LANLEPPAEMEEEMGRFRISLVCLVVAVAYKLLAIAVTLTWMNQLPFDDQVYLIYAFDPLGRRVVGLLYYVGWYYSVMVRFPMVDAVVYVGLFALQAFAVGLLIQVVWHRVGGWNSRHNA
jgi:hypothetical protein